MDSFIPQLRPYVQRKQFADAPGEVFLFDRLGLSQPRRLTPLEFSWLDLFDGQRTIPRIHAEMQRRLGMGSGGLEALADFARGLDQQVFLETPRFRSIVESEIRPPRCVGTYAADPEPLRKQVESLFTMPGGPGLPHDPRPDPSLRGVLVPHMDFGRGNVTYAWGFKEMYERTDASLFVIVGTSHYSTHRFTLTRKHFKTPLGTMPTDQEFIDRLLRHYGDGLFDDEWQAHFPEHSIELEVVMLQYLYGGKRPIRIVPLVVGSFHDCIHLGQEPSERPDIARLVEALSQAEAETKESICYVISGDLAHIGPKFNPRHRLDAAVLEHSRRQDHILIRQAEACDGPGYFRTVAQEKDGRNICGMPPTLAVLGAAKPTRGKLLHYQQFVHPRGFESVSFASMAFFGDAVP